MNPAADAKLKCGIDEVPDETNLKALFVFFSFEGLEKFVRHVYF